MIMQIRRFFFVGLPIFLAFLNACLCYDVGNCGPAKLNKSMYGLEKIYNLYNSCLDNKKICNGGEVVSDSCTYFDAYFRSFGLREIDGIVWVDIFIMIDSTTSTDHAFKVLSNLDGVNALSPLGSMGFSSRINIARLPAVDSLEFVSCITPGQCGKTPTAFVSESEINMEQARQRKTITLEKKTPH
jgi:hypothetical protein